MKDKLHKVHMSLKDKALLKVSKKVMIEFYSDANFSAIKKMVSSDNIILKEATLTTTVSPKVSQAPSVVGLLRRNSAKVDVAPTITPASPELTEKLKNLSFFDLYKESEIQKSTVAKFPELLSDEKLKAKYSEFVNMISSLETLVLSTVKSRGLTEVFNTKMRENKLIISIFKEKIEKTK